MRISRVVMWLALGTVAAATSACAGSIEGASADETWQDAGAAGEAISTSAHQGQLLSPDASAGSKSSAPSQGRDVVGNDGGVSRTDAAASSSGTTPSGTTTTVAKSTPTLSTHCSGDLPAGAQPVDTSHPTTVVGTGTAASCTFDALRAAVTKGGVIAFNCGASPVTIGVTSTLLLQTTTDTVIDGGNTVTLDGQNAVQIMNFSHSDFRASETRVTLQHLTLINGKTNPTQAIASAPSPCSQGFNDGEGGALYMRDGNLTVIDCTFSHNQAAQLGPDTGGGAIYILGSKHGALIVGSVFTDNSAANAGAIGGLFSELDIYNSLFQNNTATGNGANYDDASKCPSATNNGQHEVGSGGNGGAIYQDGGGSTNVILCGDEIVDNKAGANAFGGGVFMTSNDLSGTITVRDSTVSGNTGGSWTQVHGGNTTDLGTAFGVNAKSADVQSSTLQH